MARLREVARSWALSTRVRYWLYQTPGLVIVVLVARLVSDSLGLPESLVAWTAVAWIAKDHMLYPYFKAAYESPKPIGPEALIGSVGTAVEEIDPRGFVRVGAELWRAESPSRIDEGGLVRVTGWEGMTLSVQAELPERRDIPERPS